MKKFRKHKKFIRKNERYEYDFGFSTKLWHFGKRCSNVKSFYEIGIKLPLITQPKLTRFRFDNKPSRLLMNPVSLTAIWFVYSALMWFLVIPLGMVLFGLYDITIRDTIRAYKELNWHPNYALGYFFWMILSVVLGILLYLSV